MAVPAFGLTGAAISRAMSGMVLVGVTSFWSRRVLPVAFPIGAIMLYFGVSALAAWGIDSFGLALGIRAATPKLAGWTAITGVLGGLLWIRTERAERGRSRLARA